MALPPWARNALAFFMLGTLNNCTLVLNNAGANKILPREIGVIYIVNVVPELIVKATSPFWWHLASYRAKVVVVGLCFAVNMVLVHAGLDVPVWVKLCGVALNDFGSGLGEATVLALSQFYDGPRTLLTAWSSGTGMAGIVGYLLSMYALPNLDPAGRLLLGFAILLGYWASFFGLLERPWIDEVRAGGAAAPRPAAGGSAATVNATATLHTAPLLAAASHAGEGEAGPAAEEGGAAGAGAGRGDEAAMMSGRAKLALQLRLCKYVMPLVLVYWAEYAAQAGAWTAFALPAGSLYEKAARVRAYQMLNLTYQVGVFFSRSSGKLFRMRVPWLWLVAWLQVALLGWFIWDGATQSWVGPSLVVPAFVVGLCGGTIYVQTQVAIDYDVPKEQRELALATACAGSPAGILAADITGLFIQWCLFAYLGIHADGAGGECPFAVGNGTRPH